MLNLKKIEVKKDKYKQNIKKSGKTIIFHYINTICQHNTSYYYYFV